MLACVGPALFPPRLLYITRLLSAHRTFDTFHGETRTKAHVRDCWRQSLGPPVVSSIGFVLNTSSLTFCLTMTRFKVSSTLTLEHRPFTRSMAFGHHLDQCLQKKTLLVVSAPLSGRFLCCPSSNTSVS